MSRRVAAMALAAVLGVAGCGSGDKEVNAPTATAGTSGVQVEIGNTINYGSFGTTASIDCGNGKSLNVGGSNNTLTVSGTCVSVNIGGADNRVMLDKVENEISVGGLNSNVTYRAGDPKVNVLGSGNRVTKD